MTGSLRRSARTAPRAAALLILPVLVGLTACGDNTHVEAGGANAAALLAATPEPEQESSVSPGSDPDPAPTANPSTLKGTGYGARTDPAGMELGRAEYKRLKKAGKTGKPGRMIVCKFPDGRLAGVVYRSFKDADSETSAPKISAEEYAQSLRDFCASKYKGTWEDEAPK